MNADDIFKKLSRGIKFDRKRFRDDAEHLGIVEKKKDDEKEVNASDNIFITPLGKFFEDISFSRSNSNRTFREQR